MSRLYRRVFILNFLIMLIGFSIYSYFTFTSIEKDFIYMCLTLFICLIISTYLIVKIAIGPVFLNMKKLRNEFDNFNNNVKNVNHQKFFELELLNTALQEKYKEQKDLSETLQEQLLHETAVKEEKEHMLVHQSKLAGIGKISINIINELDEYLTSINFVLKNMKLACKEVKLDNKLISNSIEQLGKAISELDIKKNEIKDFIKPLETKKEFFLDTILMESMEMLENTFKSNNIEVDYNISKSIELFGFQTEFSQVIFNILQNAKDALVENNILNKKIFVSIKKDKDFAYVNISDNAGGIPSEMANKVFKPYFTTKSYRKASGLGLFISKIIIEENMKGKLEFVNAIDGAKFTIKLPILKEMR